MDKWWKLFVKWALIVQMIITAIILSFWVWADLATESAILAVVFLLISRSFLLEEKIKELKNARD